MEDVFKLTRCSSFDRYLIKKILESHGNSRIIFSSKWCHQESNNTIQSPNLQHFNIFGKIPEPLNQPYAKFTKFR